jgi:hypothetical protein
VEDGERKQIRLLVNVQDVNIPEPAHARYGFQRHVLHSLGAGRKLPPNQCYIGYTR